MEYVAVLLMSAVVFLPQLILALEHRLHIPLFLKYNINKS